MTTALLATRMADVQAGNTVDLKVGDGYASYRYLYTVYNISKN
jgi:hypothetical protein